MESKFLPSEWEAVFCFLCEPPLKSPSALPQDLKKQINTWFRKLCGQVRVTVLSNSVSFSYKCYASSCLCTAVKMFQFLDRCNKYKRSVLSECAHSVLPGIILCRLLIWSCVTPLSVHTLSMKREMNLPTELATSLVSESSNPLSVSKLSATLPAILFIARDKLYCRL